MQHHQDTLSAYVTKVSASPDSLAVVVDGSVAKGTERIDSDVDVYLVVTEAAFARAQAEERLSYVDDDVATYDGGYVDIKVISPDYLRRAAAEGDDPVRASFLPAKVAWTRDPDLAALVAAVPRVADDAWREHAASYIAQMRLYGGYFLRQGEQLGDPYLVHWAALHMITAAGRALLSRGQVLFSGNKYLSGLLAQLSDLPPGYLDLVEQVLARPSFELGQQLTALVEEHDDWPISREQTLSRFVRDNELAWLTRVPPPEFR